MPYGGNVNAPGAPSYASPLIDFGVLGNLANDYWQGRRQQFDDGQRQRELELQKPIDAKDPNAVASELMRRGGAPYAASLMPFLQSMQPGQVSPLLGGSPQGQPQGQPQPQSASLPAPPSGGGPAAQPAPMAVPPGGQAAGTYAGGDNGQNTVAAIVAAKGLPSDDRNTGVVITNVGKMIGADPNAPLSPEQQQRATALVDAYAKRAPGGGRAQAVPAPGTAAPGAAPAGQPAAPLTREALVASARRGTATAGPVVPDTPQVGFGERFAAATPEAMTAQASAAPAPQAQPQAQPEAPQPASGVVLPNGFTDPREAVVALRREAARVAASPNPRTAAQAGELNAWAKEIQDSMKPHNVGGALVDSHGRVVYTPQVSLTPEALNAAASGYRQTGKMPPNIGRGVQGNAERVAVQNEASRQEVEAGGDPKEWPQRWQAYGTHAAGLRVLEQRAANMTLIEEETKTLIPRVREASKKVSRTEYPDLNKIILAAKEKTGNTDVVKFGIAAESLIPVYARLLKPTGQIGVTDTQNARHILNKVWSDGQIDAALDQMELERESAKQALEDARASFGLAKTGSKKASEPEKKSLTPIDQQALDWANANPSDPRAAQIKQRVGVQ